MIEKLTSGFRTAAITILAAGFLSGCYIEPIRSGSNWQPLRRNTPSRVQPPQAHATVPGAHNNDYYRTVHCDSSGNCIDYCIVDRNQAGDPIREPCPSVEQTHKEQYSIKQVMCYKKDPKDCRKH